MQQVKRQELKDRLAGNFLLDVRTPAEFAAVHVAAAVNLPLDQLRAAGFIDRITQLGWEQGRPVYLLCKSGQRARMAAERLADLELALWVVEGGTDACVTAGLPVTRAAKPMMSLERQVRIAAGLLVLTGVLLGWLLTPGFFFLSGFVGAGLVFAGVTDTCAMGMLLARMPWNRKGGEAACCSPSAY